MWWGGGVEGRGGGVVMVLLGAFFLRPLVESTRPGGSIGPDQPHQGLADWLLPDFPPPPELQFRPSMFWISDYWRYLFGFSFLFFNGLLKKKQKKNVIFAPNFSTISVRAAVRLQTGKLSDL